MKKYSILIFAALIIFASCNKDDEETSTPTPTPPPFTISSDDMGNIGDTYYHKIDSSDVDTLNLNVVNSIVDLSSLEADYNDTTKYRNPEDYPSHTNFPDANLAMEGDNYVSFLIKDNDKIEIVGVTVSITDTTEINIVYTDNLTMLEFPITVGDTLYDTGTGSGSTQIEVSGFPLTINLTMDMEISYKNEVKEDVKTPTGTETCIKQYVQTINKMTMNPDLTGNGPQIDTTYTYRYFAKNKGDTYVEITLDKDRIAQEIKFLQ